MKSLCLCALLASGIALQAQDAGSSTYLRIDAGASFIDNFEVTNPRIGRYGDHFSSAFVKMLPGARLDISGGYMFSKDLAVELESGVLINDVDYIIAPSSQYNIFLWTRDAELYQVPVLANVIYKLPLDSKFKPYVGVGAGGIFEIISSDFADTDDFTFAVQALAGIDYDLSDSASIGIGYKFLGALEPELYEVEADNLYNHSVMAAFTYKF